MCKCVCVCVCVCVCKCMYLCGTFISRCFTTLVYLKLFVSQCFPYSYYYFLYIFLLLFVFPFKCTNIVKLLCTKYEQRHMLANIKYSPAFFFKMSNKKKEKLILNKKKRILIVYRAGVSKLRPRGQLRPVVHF